MNFKPTICVDFDGTIVEHDRLLRPTAALNPGVKEALQRFRDLGFRIVIYSCRNNPEVFPNSEEKMEEMGQILRAHDIPHDEISLSPKPIAVWYIDDKAVPFTDNWEEVANFVEDSHNKHLERTQDVYRKYQEADDTSRR